ncbi:helix-turn-helix domain-containing protein [Microbacterium sp. G2-8]|uniref:helix-turn-helix domain-containing protein n=1 Tax=Microbacterium sp. G2-8 TaxID=2842454 RepID=UPI001C8A8885|nr:helix-turn-helix domain-containing protein [Microbacterium sp. G2-8]
MVIQQQASGVVEGVRDHQGVDVEVVVDGHRIRAGHDLSQFIVSIIDQLSDGATIGTVSLPKELTTTTAAQQLGISRPTLMKLVKSGELPSHRVGTHTRILTSDLYAYRDAKLTASRQAFEELQQLEIDHGITD